MLKKICTLLIVFCMIASSAQVSYALSSSVENKKLDTLKELNILQGNGVSLDLNGQLDRSQAAAFIVRLLGKEEEVKENKIKYMNTGFSDVPMNQWYAPYIGYCVQEGIINGYSNKTFGPNDTLGEKGFLKLILTALGYKYNEDFTWSNVFETAYGAGLVTEQSYINNHIEDKDFTRGKVANLLYRALQMNHNQTKITMAYRFIENTMLTIDEAKAFGIINDDLATEVVSITPTSATTIEVEFNESIQPISIENILVYEAKGDFTVLPNESITAKNDTANTYIIKTSQSQKMDEEYIVLVDNVVDANGNPMATYNDTIIGYRADEVVSDFFRISKVEPVSNNTIFVYFTHPINENALQTAFYSIQKDDVDIVKGDNMSMLISKLSTCDNGLSIYLKNHIFTDEEYFSLNVDGQLSSVYTVRLNEGKGDSVKFKASVAQNKAFSVESCIPINNHTVQLTFNKEINPVRAEQVFSYYITDYNGNPIKINKAEVLKDGIDNGKAVRLTLSTGILVDKEYKVLINEVQDISKQFSITDKQYTFTGNYYSTEDIALEAILPVDENTIIAYVSRPLDNDYTKITGNYQVQGVNTPSFLAIPTTVYYDRDKDPNMIKIYFDKSKKLKNSETYNLRIIGMKDTAGNVQSVIKSQQFYFSNSKTVDMQITEAKAIGDNTIKLAFNKEIDYNIENIQTTNYKLTYLDNGVEYSKLPIGATYIDPQTITLKFDLLDLEKEYQLTFTQLIDYGKNKTENKDGKYYIDVIIGN